MVDSLNRQEMQGQVPVIDDITLKQCYEWMMQNFKIKQTPEYEVQERIKKLQQETLLNI